MSISQSPIRVGITGQNGFVGNHLYKTLGLYPQQYLRINFQRKFFDEQQGLDAFVRECDVIVHLAALNRHESQDFIYQTNLELARKLEASLRRTRSKAHVLFSSSSQEERDNLYGRSKREGRELLAEWAQECGGSFTGLVIPNVFGPFGEPDYNSFVATFCHKLTHGGTPHIDTDGEVRLIYVGELVETILDKIAEGRTEPCYEVLPTAVKLVSEVLAQLEAYKALYFDKGEIPELRTPFDYQLFNTYRSFIDHKTHFPVKFTQHTDPRGAFVEVIRLGIGGQCSFSTTVPGITRGNHFHTRKIERFAVIKGKARIQLRKVGSEEVLNFDLDGAEPAYVDMPVWYTHNITNTGGGELYTIFWINEAYDPADTDTYFLEV